MPEVSGYKFRADFRLIDPAGKEIMAAPCEFKEMSYADVVQLQSALMAAFAKLGSDKAAEKK